MIEARRAWWFAVVVSTTVPSCGSDGPGFPAARPDAGGGAGGSGPPGLEDCPIELWTDDGYCLPAYEGTRVIAIGDIGTVEWFEIDEAGNLYLGGMTPEANAPGAMARVNFDPLGAGDWLETTGTADRYVTKRDPSGAPLWTRTFQIGIESLAWGSAAKMPDGGVVYGGFGPRVLLDSGIVVGSSKGASSCASGRTETTPATSRSRRTSTARSASAA